jgi:Tfp pilus assembly protein PilO
MSKTVKFFRLYKDIVISIIMILIGVTGIILGIVPAVKRVIDIRNNSIELTKSIQLLRTKINILESKDINSYHDQLAQLVAAVPGDKSLPTIFTTLDSLSAQTGVTLTDFSLERIGSIASDSGSVRSEEEKQIGSHLLPFTITVNGSYDQIYQFLSKVNDVRRFFRVRNFEISFENTSAISVTMGMDSFYAPVLSGIGTVESPLEPLSQQEEDLIVSISQMPYLGKSVITPMTNTQAPVKLKEDLFIP